ncbi:MAG TPA: hypothetical protein VGM90_32285 [Kofleriaceae bacterium]|jgi:hypothetical protein
MKRLIFAMAVTLSVGSGLGACGGAQKDTETLTESVRNYNEGVRWERYTMAASSLPPKLRGAWVDEMDKRSKDLRITDYEILRMDPAGERSAQVQVKMTWYLDSVGSVKETHAMQTWERKGKEWYMVDEVRLRGDEMPGLTEPVAPVENAASPTESAPPEHGADSANSG